MIDAEQQLAFTQIRDQRMEIRPSPLQFCVVSLFDIIDAHVEAGPARHYAGYLFAQKKVRVTAQRFGCVDRIVIRDGNQVHPAALERVINLQRIAVTLAADPSQHGNRTHS